MAPEMNLEVVVPDMAGPIVGWRGWQTRGDDVLSSLSWQANWPPMQPMKAACTFKRQRPNHDSPALDCSCGIYALTEQAWRETPVGGTVQGTVNLWGRVIVGRTGAYQRGYRAEFAYPRTLRVMVGWDGTVEGIDVIPDRFRRVAEALEAYGVPVSVGLTPPMEERLAILERTKRKREMQDALRSQKELRVWILKGRDPYRSGRPLGQWTRAHINSVGDPIVTYKGKPVAHYRKKGLAILPPDRPWIEPGWVQCVNKLIRRATGNQFLYVTGSAAWMHHKFEKPVFIHYRKG
jgi:hypothetical protein